MNRIADTIIRDAENEASKILAEVQGQVNEIKKRCREDVDQLKEMEEERLGRLYQDELERLKAAVDIEAVKYTLGRKHQVLDELFGEFEKRIMGDTELYRRFITRMILDGVRTGREEIIVAAGDREMLGNGILKDVKKKLRGKITGTPALRLSDENLEGDRGVILREGRVEYDARFAVVRRHLKERCGIGVADILFEDKD